ncbi:hypothetical protein MKW98_020718 [Papaver atlanticum]|uniref:Uncharacterized protein n=1 Tax=Papaver atlanticum TaxID=357466 RepID=A0AAD4TIM1_9MAGN|nr:hypothetical protein MKW98_020718 [Papaver atlanticum]
MSGIREEQVDCLKLQLGSVLVVNLKQQRRSCNQVFEKSPKRNRKDLQQFPCIHFWLRLQERDGEGSWSHFLNIRMDKTNYKHKTRAFTPRFPKVEKAIKGAKINSRNQSLHHQGPAQHLLDES